jgi:hypothetical protein
MDSGRDLDLAYGEQVPLDYYVPYRISGGGSYQVSAVDPVGITALVPESVDMAVRIDGGDYAGGVISNIRPSLYVYYQSGQWWRKSLRVDPTGQNDPIAFGYEPQQVCEGGSFVSVFRDWADITRSVINYSAAGLDGECFTPDDEVHAIATNASVTTQPVAISLIRALYAEDGALAGLVGTQQSQMLYYDSTLSQVPKVLLGNLYYARNAGDYARAFDFALFRVSQIGQSGAVYSVYKVDNQGNISAPLYSTVSHLNYGFADAQAVYMPMSYSSTGQIVRIPIDTSQAPTIIYSGDFIDGIAGVTSKAVVAYRDYDVIAVEKTQGSYTNTLITAKASWSYTYWPVFVSGDLVYWTVYDAYNSQYVPTTGRAGISRDDGKLISYHRQSQWIANQKLEGQLNSMGDTPAAGAILVRGYTGTLDVTGQQGGTLLYYDLQRGKRTSLGVISEPGAFYFDTIALIDLLTFRYLAASGRTDLDVYSLDTVNGVLAQITNSSSSDEYAP